MKQERRLRMKKRTKEKNDKEYVYYRYVGYWCLNKDIVCSGDCNTCTATYFPGIKERLKKDLKADYLEKLKKRGDDEIG